MTALDLYEAAEGIMRQNLRRRHPNANEKQIERLLIEWLGKGGEESLPSRISSRADA